MIGTGSAESRSAGHRIRSTCCLTRGCPPRPVEVLPIDRERSNERVLPVTTGPGATRRSLWSSHPLPFRALTMTIDRAVSERTQPKLGLTAEE